MSIDEFCIKQGVPVNEFNKGYRDTHKRIHPIHVDVAPLAMVESDSQERSLKADTVRIAVTICMTNGILIKRKGLSYDSLLKFVENLEALC